MSSLTIPAKMHVTSITTSAILLVLLLPLGAGESSVDTALARLKSAMKPGLDAKAARSAWNELLEKGPSALQAILLAMDTQDTALANWLRTLFDQIVDRELKSGGAKLDVNQLLGFIREPKHHGRARRLALQVVEKLKPGTTSSLIPSWLEDPEFRYEAVDHAAKEADSLAAAGKKESAIAAYRKAFAASTEIGQAQALAAKLKALGTEVSVARHFGYLTDWYVIGPFDAMGMKGFQTAFPPESRVDLTAQLEGKNGSLRWKRHTLQEPAVSAGPRPALVNLVEPLGLAEDAVGYAFSEIWIEKEGVYEFRGAGDDNLSVWVNGRRAFGFEEYRNGVRVDRHRFRAPLAKGRNTVLVKVCQAPSDAANTETNWEFFLRLVDTAGKGARFTHQAP